MYGPHFLYQVRVTDENHCSACIEVDRHNEDEVPRPSPMVISSGIHPGAVYALFTSNYQGVMTSLAGGEHTMVGIFFSFIL